MYSRFPVIFVTTSLLAAAAFAATEQQQPLSQYAGHWTPADPDTHYITQIEIKPVPSTRDEARMHVWGKCEPRDCDWGSTTGEFRKGRLSAVWKQGDGVIKHDLTIEANGRLKLRTEARFADRAGRHAQHSITYFVRDRSSAIGSQAPPAEAR